jgi:glycosyltransferase XagB
MNSCTKERVLSLLREGNIDGISILEQDNVTLENIIFYLHSYKFDVDEQFFRALADELGLPFMEREQLLDKSNLVPTLPFDIIKDQLIILLQIKSEAVVVATANPFNFRLLEQIEMLFRLKVEIHIASIQAIEEANERGYREIHKYQALKELIDRHPDESAYLVLYKWQKNFLIAVFFLIYALFIIDGIFALALVFSFINIFYFIFNPVKFYISMQGYLRSNNYLSITDEEIRGLDESTLPIYTILIPLYKEARILPNVLMNISKLDYPHSKLDIKILLEEIDTETVEEARRLGLFGNPQAVIEPMSLDEYRKFLMIFDPVIIPNADIRTKPRACNHGLRRAKGEFCVIYDAEDAPDPDQLKKAVILFRKIGEEYACIQARLNYYNPNDNILTRWFTIEYSYWFDYYLEGLYSVGCPIPLGGTSNHFRTKLLKRVGAWDPYNVTEDADLGIRIARRKLKVCTMDSYTYEEANGHLWNWIRQRSRWNKGYIQTYLLHMRKPRELLEELGWKQFVLFQIAFGGNALIPLINPFLWTVTLLTLMVPELVHFKMAFLLGVICIINTVVSNSLYVSIHMIACLKEKMYREIPFVLVLPFYWLLLSIGAWRGLFQLLTNPFFWEKTVHGINKNFKRAETVSSGTGDQTAS